MDKIESLADLFTTFGERHDFNPIDRLNFHTNEASYCYLASGEIDFFFTETPNLSSQGWHYSEKEIQGSFHIFRYLQSGSMMVSPPLSLGQNVRLVGVPNSSVTVYLISCKKMKIYIEEFKTLRSEFLSEMRNWFQGYTENFPLKEMPLSARELKQGEHFLEAGEIFICRNVEVGESKQPLFWLHILRGKIQFLGIPECFIDSSSDTVYPAIRESWFLTEMSTKIEVFGDEGIFLEKKSEAGESLFYQQFLHIVKNKLEEKEQSEKDKFSLKQTISESNLHFAQDQLKSVLDTKEFFFKREGINPLYDTCELIGSYLQLHFNANVKDDPSKPIRERVEELCFDSYVYQRPITLRLNWWKKNVDPFLGFSKNEKNPLALLPYKRSYRIVDTKKSTTETVNETTNNEVSPHAFEFFRSFPFKSTLSSGDIWRFISHRKLHLVTGVFLLSMLMSCFNLFFPFFYSLLFNSIIPNGDVSLLIQLFLGMTVIIIGNDMFSLGREYMLLHLDRTSDREFESAIWQRILDLPLRFFRKTSIGDLLIQIFSVNEIRKNFSGKGLRIVLDSLFSMIYLIPMFYFSFWLSIAGIAILFVSTLFSSWTFVKNLNFQKKILKLRAKLNDQTLQLLRGITKIRIFGAESLIFVLWEKIFYPIKRQEWLMQRINNVTDTVNFTITSLGTLAIYATAILLLQKDSSMLNIDMGTFLAFLASFGPFSIAMGNLNKTVLESAELIPLWEKSQSLLKVPIETDFAKDKPVQIRGNVQIDHISFRYDKNGPFILNNISLDVKEGEFIGIIGPSGCGKSTLIRLLIGFEPVEKGAIYYDNKDLGTLNLRQLRKQIGIVLQTSSLIDGTLRENIAANGFYSDDEILEALTLAGFEEDLKLLPMGIHTAIIDRGNTFSGGQKQRLLIARALISKPKLLILDEATNSLDSKTQAHLIRMQEKLKVTRIVVAHRLSVLKNADKIYVLNQGTIEDVGSFDELKARSGSFANILAKQKM